MCKHFNIDVGPQAFQCSPSICTFVTTNIHQNALVGEKPVSFLHQWFQMGMNISSPRVVSMEGRLFIFVSPKWNGIIFMFLGLFLEGPQEVRSTASSEEVLAGHGRDKKKKNARGRQVLIHAGFSKSTAVELADAKHSSPQLETALEAKDDLF